MIVVAAGKTRQGVCRLDVGAYLRTSQFEKAGCDDVS